MTSFVQDASWKAPRACQEPPKSRPRALMRPSTAFKSLPLGPQEDSKSLLCTSLQTFLHSFIEEKTSKDHNTIGLWIKMAFALSTLSLPILDIQRGCSQGRVSHVMTRPIFRVSLRTTWEATRFNLHTPMMSKGDGT